MGEFPPGWAEWNDKFRDDVRKFWKGEGSASDLTKRLSASGDIFNTQGRRPWSSVNFITAHDGFTLNDLVSYDGKHNEANGEDNQDGRSENFSWNCGVEGPTDDAGINALRRRQMRNLMATLLLSQGTPMVLAGDEFARTQQGNNNAYCQDNEIGWVDWSLLERNNALTRFVQNLTRLRHLYPVLRRNLFLTGVLDRHLGIKDVTWVNADGAEMQDANWGDSDMRCFGMLMDGRARPTGIRQQGQTSTLLLVINGHFDVVPFKLPLCAGGTQWSLFVDTNIEDGDGKKLPFRFGDSYEVTARSLLLFVLEAETA